MSQIVAGNFPNKAQAESAIQALLSADPGKAGGPEKLARSLKSTSASKFPSYTEIGGSPIASPRDRL